MRPVAGATAPPATRSPGGPEDAEGGSKVSTIEQVTNDSWMPWAAFALALVAAAVYFVIASPAVPADY